MNARFVSPRTAGLIAAAAGVGLAIAWFDSRPGWDDTGITAAALFLASFSFAATAGRRPWLWAMLVGIWTPLVEIGLTGQAGSLIALAFAAAGAAAGHLSARAIAAARD
ncbi:MAG TPA: hypothetical protein VLR93_07655 [Patescibacteria group bacterium]|nr:hypothetical protein [Patescibacteria group bacterium]